MRGSLTQLQHLASMYGIRTSYLDTHGAEVVASAESLLAVLKALGAQVGSVKDVAPAARARRQEYWRRICEPVILAHDNEMLTLNLRLPARCIDSQLKAALTMENGERRELDWRAELTSVINSVSIEGTAYALVRLYLPEMLPHGYHTLKLEIDDLTADSHIICSPETVRSPLHAREDIWGIFIPLYSLQTRASWGTASFWDLERLREWTARAGGKMVGTLPLLATFGESAGGVSPYMPASRLFWNEFYIDIEHIPEFADCREAQQLVSSAGFQKELASLRSGRRVKHEPQMALKRRVLEMLAEQYVQHENPPTGLAEYMANTPHAKDYARFRAAGEKYGTCWQEWPQAARDGQLNEGDLSPQAERYHLYAQWTCHQQMQDVSRLYRSNRDLLYLDVPVGVHSDSYDVWRFRDSFVSEVRGGAPPDPVFTGGQNWNFPPLHPEGIRTTGYDYVRQSLRHQLKCAGMLRIDHIMNFHRFFWIPRGMSNHEGVYVNYPADELYAILTLESSRSGTAICGEDLGMVPPEVRPAMKRHGIYRMFVGQYQLISEHQLGAIPADAVASTNTHDMFPFAAFWQESDIAQRQKLKLLTEESALKEIEERRNVKRILISILQYKGLFNEISQDTNDILKAFLCLLALSPAYATIINLEDLWGETEPQNVPGTKRNQNWTHKSSYSLEEITHSARVASILSEVNKSRRRGIERQSDGARP